jgi:hypothetical protein
MDLMSYIDMDIDSRTLKAGERLSWVRKKWEEELKTESVRGFFYYLSLLALVPGEWFISACC